MDKYVAQRAHELLNEAFALEPDKRRSFVLAACQSDARLQQHLTQLLSAIDASVTFLQTPAVDARPRHWLPPSLSKDQLIGNYRLVRVIGRGGMATVYEAMQLRPQRRVAIKIPRHVWSGTEAIRRFRYESEVLARLQHHGIAQIYEAGTWDFGDETATPFFAMEYVDGARTIVEHAHQQDMPLADRLEMFTSVCDAVHYGHQRGIIHRDLKPQNILVDSEGRTKIIDFGIAESNNPNATWITQLSDRSQLCGTLNYMSPEQSLSGGVPDVRSDVYSLGIVLYELACQRLPHDLREVSIPEALRIVQEDMPCLPATIDPRLKGDLDAILMKAIEKEPDRRYHSVDALEADIRRYLNHQPVEARPPSVFYQCRMFTRRNRALVGSAVVLLCALLLGSGLVSAFAYRTWQESERRKVAEIKALQDRDTAVWQAYVANISGAFAALQANEFQQVRNRLVMANEKHRDWEWHYLRGMAELSDRTIHAHDDMIFAFDVTSDQTRWVSGCRDGTIRTWNAAKGTVEWQIAGAPGRQVHSVVFSPNDQTFASGSEDRSVRIWDVATGQQTCEFQELDSAVMSVCYASSDVIMAATGNGRIYRGTLTSSALSDCTDDQPGGINGIQRSSDGTLLVTWNWDGAAWLRDSDLTVRHAWTFDGKLEAVAVSEDSTRVAAGGSEGRVTIWNCQTGEIETEFQVDAGNTTVRSIRFSQEGDLLAVGQINRTISIWSVPEGERVGVLPGHEEAISDLRFEYETQRLISASWDGTIRLWPAPRSSTPLGGVSILQLHDDAVVTASFSPDGRVLATGSWDETVCFWDRELGVPFGQLKGHRRQVFGLAYSPDGQRIATGSTDRTVRLWNTATGQEEGVLTGHTAAVWTVAYSPDGKRLASAGDDRTIRIWNVETAELLQALEGHEGRVIRVVFNPSGTLIASASRDHNVRLWDAASGQPLQTLVGHRSDVFAVTFSHDGDRLYSGSRDQSVRVWDPTNGECLQVLEGHGQFVTSLTISPNGKRLAAGSWFGEIVLWDLPSGDLMAAFKGHVRAIRDVTFSPDGRFLCSVSMDNSVHLYDAAPPAERRRLRLESKRGYELAKPLAAEALQIAPQIDDAIQAIEAMSDVDIQTCDWARRLVLRSATEVGVESEQDPPSVESPIP